MDFSVTDNEDLNRERDRAEQEKRKLAEEPYSGKKRQNSSCRFKRPKG